MSTDTPTGPRLWPVPDKAPSQCASCHAAIIWTTNPERGTKIPLSVATITTDIFGQRMARSHFTDCPHAKGWSRKERNQ